MTRADDSPTVLDELAFMRVGSLLLICHTTNAPGEAEWERWATRSAQYDYRAMLVSSHGGAPGSRQRSRAVNAMRAAGIEHMQVALLSDSPTARGVLTAFAWLSGEPMRAFPLRALHEASLWLDAPELESRLEIARAHLHAALRQPGLSKLR